MSNVSRFHGHNRGSDETKRLRAKAISDSLKVLAEGHRVELTNEFVFRAIQALVGFSDDALAYAFNKAMCECEEKFPNVPVLYRFACEFKPPGHEDNYNRMVEAYVARKRLGKGDPRPLPSVLDPATPEQLGQLSRERQLALGIDKPAEVDVAARLAELRRQAGQ